MDYNKPAFRELGFSAVTGDDKLFKKAFGDALAKADVDSHPGYAVAAVLEGAFDAVLIQLENDEKTTTSIVHVIMTYSDHKLRYHSGSRTAMIDYGFEHALRRYNFLVAATIIKNIDYGEMGQLSYMLSRVVHAAFLASEGERKTKKPTATVTGGLQSIFQELINKFNKTNKYDTPSDRLNKDKWKRKVLLELLTAGALHYLHIARDKYNREDTTALGAIIDILLQFVILPVPPTEGDDPYEELREEWVRIRGAKVDVLLDNTPVPKSVVQMITRTYGLQRFCTKCNGEVL